VPAQRAAFASLGFAPTPMTIRLIGKSLAPDGRVPTGKGHWYFALGDTDIF
jgi:hypothetical protein